MGCKRGSVLAVLTLPLQISKVYTHYACTLLFFFFGLKSLYDALFKASDVSQRGSTLGSSSVSSSDSRSKGFSCKYYSPPCLLPQNLQGGMCIELMNDPLLT